MGDGPDFDTPNKQEPGRLNTGITVVGKQSVVPRGTRLGRNVKVGEKVRSTDYTARTIRSGGHGGPQAACIARRTPVGRTPTSHLRG